VNGVTMSQSPATTCGNGGTGCSYDAGPLDNISIHDNVFEDVNQSTYSPGSCCTDGVLIEVDNFESSNTLWPHDISIDHNTGFVVGSGTANISIDGPPEVISNFTYSNNLFGGGSYGFHTVLPGGGLLGCGSAAGALGTLTGCMGSSWTFASNVIAVDTGSVPNQPYPTGTYLTTWPSVGLVNYNKGNGGDYHLSSSSPYKNAGTDGKDIGADIDGVLNATAGVQ